MTEIKDQRGPKIISCTGRILLGLKNIATRPRFSPLRMATNEVLSQADDRFIFKSLPHTQDLHARAYSAGPDVGNIILGGAGNES